MEFALPLLYRPGGNVPIYLTDRIILAIRPGVDEIELTALAATHGCTVEPCAWGKNRYRLIVPNARGTAPLAVANALHERQDLIQYAHPDFIVPTVTWLRVAVAASPPALKPPTVIGPEAVA